MAADGQGATPESSGATPGTTDTPNPNDQTGATPGAGDQQDDATAALSDAGKRAIQRERERARAAEERAKAVEERLREVEEKDLPAAAKSERRIAELEEQLTAMATMLVERDVQAEVAKASAKLGVVDPDVVLVLLREEDAIDFDDDGNPVNVEAAIKDLLKTKPYLARAVASGADAGAGTRAGAAPGGNMNDLIRRAAGRG